MGDASQSIVHPLSDILDPQDESNSPVLWHMTMRNSGKFNLISLMFTVHLSIYCTPTLCMMIAQPVAEAECLICRIPTFRCLLYSLYLMMREVEFRTHFL